MSWSYEWDKLKLDFNEKITLGNIEKLKIAKRKVGTIE